MITPRTQHACRSFAISDGGWQDAYVREVHEDGAPDHGLLLDDLRRGLRQIDHGKRGRGEVEKIGGLAIGRDLDAVGAPATRHGDWRA
jgi:hypothetical protein